MISTLKLLRDKTLPKLLNEYKVDKNKAQQVLEEANKRTFQGALDG